MLMSSTMTTATTNTKTDYTVSSISSSSTTTMATSLPSTQPPRVRIRTLHVCEPSYPSREIVRQENYARRQSQKEQGWCCPPGVPYQGIDPVHLPPKPSKQNVNEQPTTNVLLTKPTSRLMSSGSGASRPKSSTSSQQDDHVSRVQYESTIRRLQTAEQQHLKRSSDVLKRVQLGHSIKDIVDKYPRRNSGRVESVETRGSGSVCSDERGSDVLYDRLLEDFEEDEDGDGASVSDIRDDIMSPRTVTNTNMTSTATGDLRDYPRTDPTEAALIPMKLCQSAPPLNKNNLKQATLRPFTPRYSSISARLRLTRHMPFRDALYRQLCCILWLLRSMGRPEWKEMISGCWNIDQWLHNDTRTHATHHHHHHHHHHGIRKQHDSSRGQKLPPTESKTVSINLPQKDNFTTSVRAAPFHADNLKKQHLTIDSSIYRLSDQSHSDGPTGRRSTLSEISERMDLQLSTAANNETTDLSESVSSKSNAGDETETGNAENTQATTTVRSSIVTPAVQTTNNTSRMSVSSFQSQLTGRPPSVPPAIIAERRRSPDGLLKKWIKNQKITIKDSTEPIPLTEAQVRLLRVGDNEDLKRIFGLENVTEGNKEHVRVHESRDTHRKLITNVKRRPMTSVGGGESRRHAQVLSKIRRDFNDFTEEQSIILNNKLEQVDNERLYFCQTKLRDLQKHMPSLIILDRLLKRLRVDEDKKKMNAAFLKYQSWYVDLLHMVQPDYTDDPIITLLLKEMEEFANPGDKPTVIRFKSVLCTLKPHEICHPDVMAAIEFIRIHVLRMSNEDFDKFFFKQFPAVTKYLMTQDENNERNDNADETKSAV